MRNYFYWMTYVKYCKHSVELVWKVSLKFKFSIVVEIFWRLLKKFSKTYSFTIDPKLLKDRSKFDKAKNNF